jgi:formate hydrogenlyase subunit 3/multisubunit Na+/H+ antiporter MnhD subunit
MFVYCLIRAALLSLVGQRYSLSIRNSSSLRLFLVALSGLPPFPIFFMKMLIVRRLVLSSSHNDAIILLLFFNSLMISGYVVFTMSSFVFFSRSGLTV